VYALCSVSDDSHDAMLRHVGFSQQIEVATTDPRPLARAVTGVRPRSHVLARTF
jgi:hypothetical protein